MTASLPDAEQPTVPVSGIDIEVTPELVGRRLDAALVLALPGQSRTRVSQAIRSDRVLVDGKPAKPSLILETGMRVVVLALSQAAPPGRVELDAAPPLQVVYEDDQMLVVNKQAGVVVHPAPGHASGTLVDAVLAHAPDVEGGEDATRPGIVHRLDKDTSGLLVIAKTAEAHSALARQMAEHAMVKRYLVLVEGTLSASDGVIEAAIGRDPRNRQRMAVVSSTRGGREARTRCHLVEARRGRSLVEAQLETGRTHQIRVHFAAIHHPVVGDVAYGRQQPPQPPRQFLHAEHLELAHPATGEWMVFDAPLPEDLERFLAKWRS